MLLSRLRIAPLVWLRPASPLALLLAPHVPHRVRIVARASPASLGACSRM